MWPTASLRQQQNAIVRSAKSEPRGWVSGRAGLESSKHRGLPSVCMRVPANILIPHRETGHECDRHRQTLAHRVIRREFRRRTRPYGKPTSAHRTHRRTSATAGSPPPDNGRYVKAPLPKQGYSAGTITRRIECDPLPEFTSSTTRTDHPGGSAVCNRPAIRCNGELTGRSASAATTGGTAPRFARIYPSAMFQPPLVW